VLLSGVFAARYGAVGDWSTSEAERHMEKRSSPVHANLIQTSPFKERVDLVYVKPAIVFLAEKAGRRTGCGVRSQVIDVLKAQGVPPMK